MCNVQFFFQLNFLNAQVILAQKNYDGHAIFLMLKMGNDPNNQASSVSWLSVNTNALELTVKRKANHIF